MAECHDVSTKIAASACPSDAILAHSCRIMCQTYAAAQTLYPRLRQTHPSLGKMHTRQTRMQSIGLVIVTTVLFPKRRRSFEFCICRCSGSAQHDKEKRPKWSKACIIISDLRCIRSPHSRRSTKNRPNGTAQSRRRDSTAYSRKTRKKNLHSGESRHLVLQLTSQICGLVFYCESLQPKTIGRITTSWPDLSHR